ncbi:MAG TPA: FG-GAP-like repeat-containing protein [Gemmataceae bacterium]|jgi:hypothetical protein|nr:FG-GAP-like repeat-containing protein [Gemmataceae bacterium]
MLVLIAGVLIVGGVAVIIFVVSNHGEIQPTFEPPHVETAAAATAEEVHRLCGACHAYPPPETFPRSAWRKEVKQGYDFFHKDLTYRFDYPPLESVVRYYESRAPEALPLVPRSVALTAAAAHFDRKAIPFPDAATPPGAAHVNLVHLFSKDKLDILVCDALGKQVLVYSPYESKPAWRVIARGVTCAHAEVVDLDGDGINDVILAVLGSFYATDDRVGSVVWLRGSPDRTFTPVTLLDGVGRVADVRPADFRGAGKLDLVVAEFGWHDTGSILLLENQTTDWQKPAFVPRILDSRHGTTHVAVCDMNGDGRPDFVAVISQEHETVVAFLNDGNGKFRQETIYKAPHPTWGSNGLQVVDLDGDGRLDVIMSNGDSLDPPYLLRPDHGITWLENKGAYPFTPHRLADCYGAGSPVVADFDGNGLLDIAFVSFLPGEFFPQREKMRLDSVVILEQVKRGEFVRHAIEMETCDHLTCAAGDLDGKGRPDLVVGNYVRGGRTSSGISIWRNSGK